MLLRELLTLCKVTVPVSLVYHRYITLLLGFLIFLKQLAIGSSVTSRTKPSPVFDRGMSAVFKGSFLFVTAEKWDANSFRETRPLQSRDWDSYQIKKKN